MSPEAFRALLLTGAALFAVGSVTLLLYGATGLLREAYLLWRSVSASGGTESPESAASAG